MFASEPIPETWQTVLAPALNTSAARALDHFLIAEEAAGKKVYPPREHRFAALTLTPLDSVKVVIIGQDPYHGPGEAHGLCFSVPYGVKVPPSLVNIYKEIESDLGLPRPKHGNLEKWAQQGILLINDVLTVERDKAGSHKKHGWEGITDAVVAAVAAKVEPCVFLLWGEPAKKKAERIEEMQSGRHLVLSTSHPSPLSARKGFTGCKHFSQTNVFLESKGRGAIDWRI